MKSKPFWEKLIYSVVAFMMLINGILPTNTVNALMTVPDAYINVDYVEDENGMIEIRYNTDDDASFIESVISGLLLLLGTAAYALLTLAIGEPFSIEKVIFNEYTNTNLDFFNNNGSIVGANEFLNNGNIKEILNDFYNFFRGIALAVYLIILIYMGIRILLGSTAEKGSKYKELIFYWIQGVLMLFVMPFVMKYTIHINNAFVKFIGDNMKNNPEFITVQTSEAAPEEGSLNSFSSLVDSLTTILMGGDDFMSYMYKNAWTHGWLVYTICWLVMFFQMIGFLITYFKRVIVLLFLIAIFPLVMISYAIDKIGDGKSQAFGNWLKEYLLNVFVQSFHAITYVLIMSFISSLGNDPKQYWLVMLIAITFISKGDDILRGIFSLTGTADTVRGIGASLVQAAGISRVVTGAPKVAQRIGGAVKGVGAPVAALNQKAWNYAAVKSEDTSLAIREAEINGKNGNENFMMGKLPDLANMTDDQLRADIEKTVQIALDRKKAKSDDEYRNALDKLTGYVNKTDDDKLQSILKDVSNNLSSEDRAKIRDLLNQNAAVNSLIVGGRKINFRNNIDLVLKILKRDANGNLTPESLALLKKVANSEEDLKEKKIIGFIKLNKDDALEAKKKRMRVSNNPYYTGRENGKKIRGRSVARNNKEEMPEAKSAFEAMRQSKINANGNGATKTNGKRYTAKGSIASRNRRDRNRQRNPGQERAIYANEELAQRVNQVQNAQGNVNSEKKSKFRTLKKPTKPQDNVTNMQGETASKITNGGSKGSSNRTNENVDYRVQTSNSNKGRKDPLGAYGRYYTPEEPEDNNSNATTTSKFNIPEKNTVNTAIGERDNSVMGQKELNEKIRERGVQSSQNQNNANSKVGTNESSFKRSYGDEKDKKKKKGNANSGSSASNSSGAARPSSNTSKQNPGQSIAEEKGTPEDLENRLTGNTIVPPKEKPKMKFNGDELLDGTKLYESVVKNVALKPVIESNPEIKNDLISLASSIAILQGSKNGKHSAEKLLKNIENIKNIAETYKDSTKEDVLNKIISKLGHNIDTYESSLRIEILNDPDTVNNNRRIIDECKEYVRNTEIPQFLYDRLEYDLDDLEPGVNLKHIMKNGNSEKGIRTSEEIAKAMERDRDNRELQEIQARRAQLRKELDDEYSAEKIGKAVGKTAVDTILASVDAYAEIIGATSLGIIGMGMTVDGKQDALFEAPERFITSTSMVSDAYNTVKGNAKDVYKGVKSWIPKEEKKKQEKSYYSGRSVEDLDKRINSLKNKTKIVGNAFDDDNED